MGIRDIFSRTWKDAVVACALNDGVEIIPESRIIVRTVDIHGHELGDCVIVYGDKDYPQMVSSRFPPDALLLSAFMHIMEQRGRLRKAGITTKFVRQNGVIQCIYMKESPASVLESVQRSVEQSQQEHTQSTTSEQPTE